MTSHVLILLASLLAARAGRADVEHYVFFGFERERIADTSFLANPRIAGAQIKYSWRQLEPHRDRYEFGPLLEDLALLERHGKRLFVQLQEASFSDRVLVPDYLLQDTAFHGGAAREYTSENADDSNAKPAGWVARRWDPAVQERFARLLDALGQAVDGRIEGLALPETSLEFGASGKYHPAGFTFETYLEGVKRIMSAAKRAFPRACVIQYANFMPGEWLPGDDHGYLRAVYAHAARIGMGVGGPDVLPHRRGQQNHGIPLIAARSERSCAGVAVQDGNLAEVNPATGRRVTAAELYAFVRDRLHADYIFWGTEEPYYSADVLPFIAGAGLR